MFWRDDSKAHDRYKKKMRVAWLGKYVTTVMNVEQLASSLHNCIPISFWKYDKCLLSETVSHIKAKTETSKLPHKQNKTYFVSILQNSAPFFTNCLDHHYSLRNQYRQWSIFRFRDKNTKVIGNLSQISVKSEKNKQQTLFVPKTDMGNTMKVIKYTVVNTSRLFKNCFPFAPRNQRKKTEYIILLVQKFLKKSKEGNENKSNLVFHVRDSVTQLNNVNSTW